MFFDINFSGYPFWRKVSRIDCNSAGNKSSVQIRSALDVKHLTRFFLMQTYKTMEVCILSTPCRLSLNPAFYCFVCSST